MKKKIAFVILVSLYLYGWPVHKRDSALVAPVHLKFDKTEMVVFEESRIATLAVAMHKTLKYVVKWKGDMEVTDKVVHQYPATMVDKKIHQDTEMYRASPDSLFYTGF